MKRYVIFDMDGTIFDTEQLTIRCWKTVAAEYAMPDVEVVCRECLGVNAKETESIFFSHYGDHFPIKQMKQKVRQLLDEKIDAEGPPIKPHADFLLQFLSEKECLLAVASSTNTDIVKKELQQAGLLSYFQQIIGGDMVSRGKPEPDIFLLACEKLGCEPKDAVVIEDSFSGIRAAHAAGAMALMVPDLLSPTTEIHNLCCGVFSDLSEVQKYFENNLR